MESSTSFLAVALISLIAAISPGPDFFIVFRNSLVHSRKAGFLTAFGVSMAIIVHLSYSLIGIGVLIAESPFLYAILKYSGVAYLFYIGLKGIISSFKQSSSVVVDYTQERNQISALAAFMQGFWTNLLNPKAAIFFISLFSQFIDTKTPYIVGIEYGAITWSVALGWFLLLSYLLTHKQIVGKIDQFRIYVDRVMGGILMLLGFKMLFV
ncbi:MAG: LysE family transporter [Parachlamydiaceae bacterium]